MIKSLEIKISLATLFCCVFFISFLIIELYFLIVAVNFQIYNPTTELAMLTGTPTNEANEEIETQLLTAETKDRKCSK